MAQFANRLDSIFEAAEVAEETQPVIIDISDQEAAMKALARTRGPCNGYEDWAAGRDYQPPYIWDTADPAEAEAEEKSGRPIPPRFVGTDGKHARLGKGKKAIPSGGQTHQARSGSKIHIKTPAVPIGPQDTRGKNKFAAKYGGVRPWSQNEVLEVLLYKSKDENRSGLIWKIALKGNVRKAFQASGQAYDPESVIGLAASAAWRGIMKDQARPGTRFTSYIGMYIEEAATSGSPAGFGDEYKKARGTLSRWQKSARAAARGLDLVSRSTDMETGAVHDEAMQAQGLQLASGALEEIEEEYNTLDRRPGPNNPYGNLVTKLLQAGGDLMAAIRTGSAERVMQSESYLGEVYEEVQEQESRNREHGPSTNTLIRKSKNAAPIMVGGLQVQKPGSDQETEVSNVATPGVVPGSKALGTWAFRWQEGNKERTKNVNNPIGYLQTHLGLGYEQARNSVQARQDIPVRSVGGQPAGTLTFVPSNPGADYAPAEASIRDDPQMKDALTSMVHLARMGSGSGVGRHAKEARKVIAQFRRVAQRAHEPAPQKRYSVEQPSGSYDLMSDTEGWWVYDVDLLDQGESDDDVKVAGPFRTELRASQEAQKLLQSAKDYRVVDMQSGEVVGSHEISSDATAQAASLNANPLLVTINKTVQNLNPSDYGEYTQELQDVGRQLLGAMRSGDLGQLPEIEQELDALDQVAAQQQSDPSTTDMNPLTSQQYRIFLRIYGVSDYPEKGTVDDPEIDDSGQLSQWARMGYPPVEGAGANRDLANELGISTTRISQHRKMIAKAVATMIEKLQLGMKEEIDPIDYDMMNELKKAFQTVFLEYVIIHGRQGLFLGEDYED